MMDTTASERTLRTNVPVEQRRGRSASAGSAIVLSPTRYIGTYTFENLSTWGALLLGDPGLAVGERVRLLVQLHRQTWRVAVDAIIVRRGRRGERSIFAVHFSNLSADAVEAIAGAVREGGAGRTAYPTVLLVDASSEEAEAFCGCVDALGLFPVAVQTPLDALAWLQAKDVAIEAVVVRPRSHWPDQLNLLEFVAAQCPRARRIILSLDEEQPASPAAGLVFARLAHPCDRGALTQAIGA